MSSLSDEVRGYLEYCGLSKDKISRSNADTRLYHDLDIYGDEAEAFIEVLVEKYEVDMTGFVFESYFPLEFPGRSMLEGQIFWWLPFLGDSARRKGTYTPLTMAMLEQAIDSKRWPPSVQIG